MIYNRFRNGNSIYTFGMCGSSFRVYRMIKSYDDYLKRMMLFVPSGEMVIKGCNETFLIHNTKLVYEFELLYRIDE